MTNMDRQFEADLSARLEPVVATGMDATSKASTAVSKLVKLRENRQAQQAARISGLGLMAVSLAACGGSSTTTSTTSTTTTTTTTTPTVTVTPISRSFTANASETITGTTADDSVRGDSADVTASDSFDGGDGTDTFTLNHTGEGAVRLPALSNVEIVIINEAVDTDEDGTGLSVDAADALGVTTWILDNIDDDSSITNVDKTDIVKIIDNDGTTVDITVGYRSVTGSADSATIQLDGFDASSDLIVNSGIETLTIAQVGSTASTIAELDIDNVTTLNLSATNTALTITEADAGADNEVTSIVISGDKAVTITNALSTAVTSIDASANTAGASVTLTGLTAPTFTGGSGADTVTAVTTASVVNTGAGNDTVTLGAIVLTSAASLNGGAGDADVLEIGDDTTTLFTATARAAISGFEVLKVTGVNTETVDFDLKSGFTGLALGANTALTVTDVTNAVTAAGVAVSGVQTTSLIFTITDATVPGTTNTLKLDLDHATASTAVTIADLQAAGVETLTVTSNGAGTNTNSIELGTETSSLSTVNISGSSNFTLTTQGAADVAGIITVAGSSATGVLTITLSGEDDGSVITTGSGDDVITGGTAVDVISSGAGADTLNISGGLDRYTGGSGIDNYKFAASYDDGDDAITISDFTAGTGGDKISFDVSEMDGGVAALIDNLDMDAYVEGSVATIGTNTSSTAFASNSMLVITDTGFANIAAVEAELAIENGGTDLTDFAVLFLNTTSGYAELYVSDTTANATNDFKVATFTNITTLAGIADLNAANFTDF